ncbi:MAG: hypothetical protein MI924_31200 [Chloroflexales bacterium]|nr:hypothetical protein [Chloroflexales bacterium]
MAKGDDIEVYTVYRFAHPALYAAALGALADGVTLNQNIVVGFDIFCIVHALLHILFIKHPRYQFNNPFSWTLIFGAGIAGGIDLMLRL